MINLTAVSIANGFAIILYVVLLSSCFWKNNKNKSEARRIRGLIYVGILNCVADLASFHLDGVQGTAAFIGLYISNLWLFFANVLLGVLFTSTLVTHLSNNKWPKTQRIFNLGLCLIGVAFLIVNFFDPIVFGITDKNVYYRGPLFFLFLGIELLYAIDSIAFYIHHKITKKENAVKFPLLQFIVPELTGIIVQSIFYGISTMWPSTSIAICGVVLALYNEGEEERKLLKQHEQDAKIIIEQREEVNRALIAAEKANKAKTEFLFNMSHDIRTPMNAILGYADIAIRHGAEPDKVAEYLEKIKTSGSHLLDLINDILEMSRIESGKLNIARNPLDLRESCKNVIQISQALALTRSIDFTYDIDAIKDPYILSDELHINEILINLISNAVKYNHFGGKVVFTLEQISEAENGIARYRFIVTDNGIGMSEEFLTHIFEDFSREQSSTVSKEEGSGLGLAIVKKIVDFCKGTISVESKKGKGSKFTVDIPLEIMSDEQIKEFTKEKNLKENCHKEDSDLIGKKVLLVEDNFMNREIASEILTEAGLQVETAEDGSIAVDKFSLHEPDYYDFILMDIQMPVMNGYEATKAIRNLPNGDKIIIIALSANAFKEDIAKSLANGMNDHVAKPIKIANLFSSMKKQLTK